MAKELPKGSPQAVPGIFLGLKLLPGGLWQGEYKVADLTEFQDMDLSVWGRCSDIKTQTVREVLPLRKGEPIIFPLRERYDFQNRTLDGLEGIPFGGAAAPPPADELFPNFRKAPVRRLRPRRRWHRPSPLRPWPRQL